MANEVCFATLQFKDEPWSDIVGIPIALQHIKLLPLALLPFGRVVRDMETGREYP